MSRAVLLIPAPGPAGGHQERGREAARRALALVAEAVEASGFRAEALQVRVRDLADPRVLRALQARRAGALPALLAEGRAFVGCREIEGHLRGLAARARAGARPPAEPEAGAAGGEDEEAAEELRAFYHEGLGVPERGGGRARADPDESGGEDEPEGFGPG